MTQEPWTPLTREEECPVGRGRFVAVEGHELAIFHLSDPDRFVVVKNSCPHAGGNLAAGEIVDGVVTCPWHQWPFDLDRGVCTLSETVHLRQYETRVVDGYVCARLDKPAQ